MAKDYSILYPPFNVKITDLRILLVYEIARNADVLKPDVSQTELINPSTTAHRKSAGVQPPRRTARPLLLYGRIGNRMFSFSQSAKEWGWEIRDDKGLPFLC